MSFYVVSVIDPARSEPDATFPEVVKYSTFHTPMETIIKFYPKLYHAPDVGLNSELAELSVTLTPFI